MVSHCEKINRKWRVTTMRCDGPKCTSIDWQCRVARGASVPVHTLPWSVVSPAIQVEGGLLEDRHRRWPLLWTEGRRWGGGVINIEKFYSTPLSRCVNNRLVPEPQVGGVYCGLAGKYWGIVSDYVHSVPETHTASQLTLLQYWCTGAQPWLLWKENRCLSLVIITTSGILGSLRLVRGRSLSF
jgi:hypothetical protein